MPLQNVPSPDFFENEFQTAKSKILENEKNAAQLPFAQADIESQIRQRLSAARVNNANAQLAERTEDAQVNIKILQAIQAHRDFLEWEKDAVSRGLVRAEDKIKLDYYENLFKNDPEKARKVLMADKEKQALDLDVAEYGFRKGAEYDFYNKLIEGYEKNPQAALDKLHIKALSQSERFRRFNFNLPEEIYQSKNPYEMLKSLRKQAGMSVSHAQKLEQIDAQYSASHNNSLALADYNRIQNDKLKERTLGTNEFFLPNGQKVTQTELRQQYKQAYNIMDEDELQSMSIMSSASPEAARAFQIEREKADKAPSFEEWARKERNIDVTGKTNLGSVYPGDKSSTPTMDELPMPEENPNMRLIDSTTGDILQPRKIGGEWVWFNVTKNKKHVE